MYTRKNSRKNSSNVRQKRKIVVYTDGSCINNGKPTAAGGFGIHFPNGELKDISRIFTKGCCTNQKTELYAILVAIKYIEKNFDLELCTVIINTDSEYSINSVTKWAHAHSKNNWRKKNGIPIANKQFIEPIYEYYQNYDIEIIWVEAHTGARDARSMANARADYLANRAAKKSLELGGCHKFSGGKTNRNNFNSKTSFSNSRFKRNSSSSTSDLQESSFDNESWTKKSTRYPIRSSNKFSRKQFDKFNQNKFPVGDNFIVELASKKPSN
ncbi:putative ribonuclease H protein [Cotonvirus japonicus]|uniref:ribonuclease H n=1 Tax=Cotonvirus japonicus TaxID=2811091 RepID=A0ABM7NSY8_9VIRU|nr:putative ribonuclease H protein [Cotonvirus japonicus]BCS83294.1 putative ribonuclease H protein [Cotonvirus japonicus]